MAENLIYPVRFDLESAVKEATGDAEKVLARLGTMVASRPLKLGVELESPGNGSIKSIRKKMEDLVKEWDKLSEANRITDQQSGKFTEDAKKILSRYSELVAASQSYAKSLEDIEKAARKTADAELEAITKAEEAEKKKKNKQLQIEWNAAADKHKKEQRQWEAEQAAIGSQVLSYDALMAKRRAWQNIQNRNEVGSRDWENAANAIRHTDEMLALVTQEMNRTAKAIERIRALREVLAANEQTMAGLNAKLAEYNSRLQGLEVGSAKFNKTAMEVARLNEELRRASQYAQDFAQKAFQGLSAGETNKRVTELQLWRQELRKIDEEYNRLRNFTMQNGSNASMDKQLNALLEQRMNIVRNINQSTLTAEQAQIQREQEINRITEERKRMLEDMRKKEKEHDKAKGERAAFLIAQKRRKLAGELTEEQKKKQKLLSLEENTIGNINKKLAYFREKLNNQQIGSSGFKKTAAEIDRLTQLLESHEAKTKSVGIAYKTNTTYLERLLKRMAVYASVGQIGAFVSKIREVTAEFELQKVSLGAILQDTNKANALFAEIKSFAMKSPVTILDLTKYTKQLAAYKIGYEELWETTKRLTDVSVGLGVSMDRIVLLYGQVRATGYLRATEIRQATEAGIPIVEELAAKLTQLNGELVTAKDVMDMVSKRAISFELVKEVFNDMTSAGGIFYNMQEKQGNTLYGLWAKLGDAASIMYSEIGETSVVNGAMRTLISWATSAMKSWSLWAGEIGFATLGIGAMMLKSKLVTVTQASQEKSLSKLTAAQTRFNAAQASGSKLQLRAARYALKAAQANRVAAMSTNAWTTAQLKLNAAMNSFKAALLGNWATIVIALVAAIAYAIYDTIAKVHKLDNELAKLDSERVVLQSQSVRRFEHLADVVVKSADGSKAQKDALDELQRTYKDMIPVQDLSVERLRQLRSGADSATEAYRSLTVAIREHIAEQQKEKKLSAIEEEYQAKLTNNYKKMRKSMLDGFGYDEFKMSDAEVEKFFADFEKRSAEAGKDLYSAIKHSLDAAGVEDVSGVLASKIATRGSQKGIFSSYAEDYVKALTEMEEHTRAVHEGYAGYVGDLGKYSAELSRITKEVNNTVYAQNGKALNPDSFLKQQMERNKWIKEWTGSLKNSLKSAGVEIKEEWANIVESVNASRPGDISSIDFDALLKSLGTEEARKKLGDHYEQLKNYIFAIRKEYDNLIPADRTVAILRAKMVAISDTTGVSMDKLQRYWMKADEDVEEYAKSIKDAIDELQKSIENMNRRNADVKDMKTLLPGYTEEEIRQTEALLRALQMMFALINTDKSTGRGSGRSQSDQRLQNLKEEISLYEKLYQEYTQYEKTVGGGKAVEYMTREAKDTIDALAKKYGIGLPKSAAELTSALEVLYKKMGALPRSIFKTLDKELKEFRWKIEKVDIDDSQKKIEAQLKELADRISRSRTAKEFYDKILGLTGDYDMASKVSLAVYGDTGHDLQKRLAEQVRGYFQNDRVNIEIPVDVITADNRINYKRLDEFAEQMKEKLGEKPYEALKKIAEEGRKGIATAYEGYLKDLEIAKTYADKRVELARTTAAKIREIEQNPQLDKEQKEQLKRGYQEREEREAAKLEYEAFKDTPLYVQMFEDLEQASTTMLTMMKSRLEGLKGVWGNALNPTQLKELQSRMNEIDEQLRTRNPFKTLQESYRQYRDSLKGMSLSGAIDAAAAASKELYERSEMYGADSAQARAAEKEVKVRRKIVEIARQLNSENKKGQKLLDAAAQKANDELTAKRKALEIASAEEQELRKKSSYEDPDKDPKVVAAQKAVEAAKTEVDLAERVAGITTEMAHDGKTWKESLSSAAGTIFKCMNAAGDLAHSIADLTAAFGGDEEDVQFWNDIADAIGNITAGAQDLVDSILHLDIAGIVSSVVTAVPKMVIGFFDLFSAGKIRKANKEIKKQQKLLDQLGYAYERLGKAADSLFGRDYTSNYRQQIKNLQSQQKAYLKQAEAERSKGKKADKEKIEEYTEKAREMADEIKELQADLAAHFTGSSRTDVARQMAQSWIDARASMSDTFAAIKGDYQDMVKNMIVEGAAARVIENALSPMWDKMERMLERNDVDGAIDALVNGMDAALSQANDGMEVLWNALEARGYNLKELLGDTDAENEYKGIAKEISGATSEEINNVAAIGNTLMYYVSPIPRMDENLAAIRVIMESGGYSGRGDIATKDYTDIFTVANEHLSNLPSMERHLSEIHTMLGRVITSHGGKFGMNTFLNS